MAVPTAYAQPIAPVPASMAQEKQDPRIAAYYKRFPQMVPAADVDAASVEARFRAGKTVPLAEALGYAAQLPSEQRTNEQSTGCYCLKTGGACCCPVGLPVGVSCNTLCGESCLYTPTLSPTFPCTFGVCEGCYHDTLPAFKGGPLPKPPGAWISGDKGEGRLAIVDGERGTHACYLYPNMVEQPCVVCYRLF